MASRVTILRFSPPGVIDVDATPFFESPGKGARNDWDGDIGIRFVACVTFAVTHLGRACAAGGRLREAAAVQLWCAETRALLAEADVGPSSPVEEAFAFEPLAGRVELQGGQEYRLSQRCRAGMPDLWPDARAEVGAGWHDPVEAAALAEAGQGGPPWAVAYATFVGGAYNFDGGYPSFDDLSGRRVGMVNLKIAPHIAVLTLDPAAHISELKAALEEVTGLPPARQRLALGHRALLSAGETLAAAGVGHGALLTLEMLSGTQAVTCAGHTARVWNAEDGSCVCTLEGHEDDVLVAEFSPDSTRVITGSADGSARIWSVVESGECLRVLAGHSDQVQDVAFRPPLGDLVLTASRDHSARLWDAGSGLVLRTLSGHSGSVVFASFSIDGSLAVSASLDGTARLWSLATDASRGQCLQVLAGHQGSLFSAAISPDCSCVLTAAVGGEDTVKLWTTSTGSCCSSFRTRVQVRAAVLSPDGSQVAAVCCDHVVRIFRDAEEECSRELTHDAQVLSAAFSGDGGLLAVVDAEHRVWLWSLATEAPATVLTAHSAQISRAIFSLDGQLLLTASADGTAKVWDVIDCRCRQTLEAGGRTRWASVSG